MQPGAINAINKPEPPQGYQTFSFGAPNNNGYPYLDVTDDALEITPGQPRAVSCESQLDNHLTRPCTQPPETYAATL